jgi:hypothetical protein
MLRQDQMEEDVEEAESLARSSTTIFKPHLLIGM